MQMDTSPCHWLVMLLLSIPDTTTDTTTPLLCHAHMTYSNESNEHTTLTLLPKFPSQSQQAFNNVVKKKNLLKD